MQIDDHVAQRSGDVGTTTDAEFLRRVSLDLIGVPPTAKEVRNLLADESSEKRTRVVDRLLASPLFPRHMAEFFDVMLMERRANPHVSQDDWMAYLLQSFRDNKPWNVLARELLAADGSDDDPRPAARFYLDRACEPNLLTRDVGRIFFGRDMQCAQCHDHPLIDDYLHSDYQGLSAFFTPGYELKVKEGDKERAFYAERAGTDVHYESVFEKGTKHMTGPRVPGEMELAEPMYLPGEEYTVAPADNIRPVPKFSRRARLAEIVTSGDHRPFNENIANRLWALMMGRGLVHPVDLHHSGNPAADPELLALLGDQFAAMKFDIRAFLRELALTRVYQRPLETPDDLLTRSTAAAALVVEPPPEREAIAAKADASQSAFIAALAEWQQAEAKLLPLVDQLDTARKQYQDTLKKVGDARKAVKDAEAAKVAKEGIATAVTEVNTKALEVVAKLPDDKELAAAAAKFTERMNQLNAEVATLQKTVDEKTAAVAAPESELATTRPPVETAQQSVAPLREQVRQKEEQMLAARRQMNADAIALKQFDERQETLKLLAKISPLEQAAAASAASIPIKQAELAAAEAQIVEYAPTVKPLQEALQAAEQVLATAAQALAAVEQQHAEQAATAKLITDAFANAELARQKLPEDPALADACTKLQQKSQELAAGLTAHQVQVAEAQSVRQTAADKTAVAKAAFDGVMAEADRRRQAGEAAEGALATAQQQAESDKGAVETARQALAARWSANFTLADLEPLSPEQIGWSILRVTGVYDRQWQATADELDKATPLTDADKQDAAKIAARDREIEQKTYEQLKQNLGTFVALFGGGPGQPQTNFFATPDQALFTANNGAVVGWVAPAAENITSQLVAETDLRKGAEELYLTILSRMPTEEEIADVSASLSAPAEKRAAVAQELVWGLLTSAEFRFNH